MGIFNRLFGGAPETNSEQWDAVLNKCDLVMARDEIADMHKIVKAEGDKEGGAYLFKNEYVAAWDTFRDNPNIENARALLDVAPMLLDYFEGCSPGGNFHATNRYVKDHGLET